MSYAPFAAMIAVSTIFMYGLMFLNTYAVAHVAFSQTRMWMALLMGAVMTIIMIGFMAHPGQSRAPDLASYRERGIAPPPEQTDNIAGIDTLKAPRSHY